MYLQTGAEEKPSGIDGTFVAILGAGAIAYLLLAGGPRARRTSEPPFVPYLIPKKYRRVPRSKPRRSRKARKARRRRR